MKPSQIVVPVLCLLVGGLAGYGLGSGAAGDGDAAATALADAQAEAERLVAERDEADHRAKSAERDLASARRDLAAARTAAEEAAADATSTTAGEPESTTDPETGDGGDPGDWRVRVQQYPLVRVGETDATIDEAMQQLDWEAVAEHMSAMVPLLTDVVESLAAGRTISGETQGGIQVHNGHLVVAAVKLMNGKVPGTGANGSFTHPAVMANMISGNLEALGMPLNERQNGLLATAAQDFTRRDTERLAGYTDETLAIRKLLEESRLKGEFFDEAFRILTTEQHDALSPEPVRGLVAVDLHSQGLVWAGRAEGVAFRDRAHLAQLIERRAIGSVPEEGRENARQIIGDWAEQLPAELVEQEMGAFGKRGWIPVTRVEACAAHILDLAERLLRDGSLDETAIRELRTFGGTLVPYPASDD